MKTLPLTVATITFNEEKHIASFIQNVHFAKEILVVDSFSTDKTYQISKEMGARVFSRAWPGYGQQKNFCLQQAQYDWVLFLDADERVSADLEEELFAKWVWITQQAKGYAIKRKTFYGHRWIRYGGWYPNYSVRLCHKSFASWTTPKVHEVLSVQGAIEKLKSPILHYSFSNIIDQIHTNCRFASLASEQLYEQGCPFSLWKLCLKPLVKFLETYVWKFGFLDGIWGLIIAGNAAHSMFLKYAFLKEKYENSHSKQ